MVNASVTTIDLVRHGEVLTPDLYCAPADELLSKQGWAQLAPLKKYQGWDVVITSSSTRCSAFATELAGEQNLSLIIEPTFQELDFGDWTGRTRQSIWETDQTQLTELWSNPLGFKAPQGESMIAFIKRIESAWQAMLKQHQGKNILLICHAGVIRAIASHALGLDYRHSQKLSVDYGRIHRLHCYDDNEVSLSGWNWSVAELSRNTPSNT